MLSILITTLIGLAVLSFLIFIHEAGHFLTARFFKVKVLEFGLGFPFLGRMFSFKRGETLYSINWLFFGGFVQLYGEESGGEDLGKGSFSAQNVWVRIAIAAAGVIVNILFAVIVFTFMMASSGFKMDLMVPFDVKFPFGKQSEYGLILAVDPDSISKVNGFKDGDKIVSLDGREIRAVERVISYVDSKEDSFITVAVQNTKDGSKRELEIMSKGAGYTIIDNVEKDTPAEKAGLRKWDKIILVDGRELEQSKISEYIKSKSGRNLELTVQNAFEEEPRSVSLIPRKTPPSGQGALGISLNIVVLLPGMFVDEATELSYNSLLDKIFVGVFHSVNLVTLQTVGLKEFIAQSFAERSIEPIASKASGPVGVVAALGILVQNSGDQAINTLLTLMALISLMLGIGNLLPIPAVDGGRLAFFYIEALTGKKVSARVENLIHGVGFVILLGLIVLISINDVIRIVNGKLFG